MYNLQYKYNLLFEQQIEKYVNNNYYDCRYSYNL